MASTRRKQRRVPGDFLRVPLEKGWHTYSRVLHEPLLAFYDARTNRDLEPTEIASRPILFKVWVMNHAIGAGRWSRIGNLPLEPELHEEPTFFKQDSLDPSSFRLYRSGRDTPATREQCAGLERAAVWEPEHVEERLRDHYAGRPNKWLGSLSLRG
jgi:hypothetical protein